MGKKQLKLYKYRNTIKNVRIKNKTKSNTLTINPRVDIKEDKIYIFYNEQDIIQNGFEKIVKVEIYKDMQKICSTNKVSNYFVEFPFSSPDGTYEIKTMVLNSNDRLHYCFINTFEFLNAKKNLQWDKLDICLKKINRHLNINFNKELGDIDLSHITLSNINIFDSKNNQIKNVVCKIYNRYNSIDFIMLDVFGDSSLNKLIPNEVYTVNIKYKNRDIFASFLFEYDNIPINAYRVIENVKYEILSSISKNVLSIKLNLKVNSFISIEDYDFLLLNIRNKFLYSSSINEGEENEIVFECIVKREKGSFELNVVKVKEKSVAIVHFDYDFTEDNEYIRQRTYFSVPKVNKDSNKYKIKTKCRKVFKNKTVPILSTTDVLGKSDNLLDFKNFIEKGKVHNTDDNETQIVFENVGITNRFGEIHVIQLDNEYGESFVFSPSIGVKFSTIKSNMELQKNGDLRIHFLNNNYSIKGWYTFNKKIDYDIEILNNCCDLPLNKINEIHQGNLFLKVYDDNNRLYYQTINLNYIIEKPVIKIFQGDKFVLDSLNYATLIDRNVYKYFKKDFEVCILDGNENLIQKIKVNNLYEDLKILFAQSPITKKGIYYIKYKDDNNYKICTYYVSNLVKPQNVFITIVNELYLELMVDNFVLRKYRKSYLNINMTLLLGDIKHKVYGNKVSLSSNKIRVYFNRNTLISSGEYLISINIENSKNINIKLTILGEAEYSNIYEKILKLNESIY